LVREAISNVEIDHTKVQFKDKIFQTNEYGAILDWPNGFADIESKTITNILANAIKRRKKV
jgi:hypothetical protein